MLLAGSNKGYYLLKARSFPVVTITTLNQEKTRKKTNIIKISWTTTTARTKKTAQTGIIAQTRKIARSRP